MKAAGSNLGRIFLVIPRCLLVQYSVGPLIKYNSQWLSGLSLPTESLCCQRGDKSRGAEEQIVDSLL